jgi:hypothetical protein
VPQGRSTRHGPSVPKAAKGAIGALRTAPGEGANCSLEDIETHSGERVAMIS